MQRGNYWSIIQYFTDSNLLATLILPICDCSFSEKFCERILGRNRQSFWLWRRMTDNFSSRYRRLWNSLCDRENVNLLPSFISMLNVLHCIFSVNSINRTTIIKALECSDYRIFRFIEFQTKTTKLSENYLLKRFVGIFRT